MQTGRKRPYLHLHLPHLDHLEEEFVPAVLVVLLHGEPQALLHLKLEPLMFLNAHKTLSVSLYTSVLPQGHQGHPGGASRSY